MKCLPKKIGIIGTGHLAGFLVEGMVKSGADCEFTLSPRGAQTAASLTEKFGAKIGTDNQSVIDVSDLIIIAVLPDIAKNVLEGLKFTNSQVVLSTMAGVSHATMSELVSPASTACTMMPGLSNSLGIGPSILYPNNPVAEGFLKALGPVHTFTDWNSYQTASVFGGFSGNTFIFMKQIIDWFISQGLDDITAKNLIAETLRGNAEALLQSPLSVDELISTVATPGGITARGAISLKNDGADKAWHDALNAISQKIKSTQ